MKQTNFQRKMKFKRTQSIIQKFVNNLRGKPEFLDKMFENYRDLLLNGFIEPINEGYIVIPYVHKVD